MSQKIALNKFTHLNKLYTLARDSTASLLCLCVCSVESRPDMISWWATFVSCLLFRPATSNFCIVTVHVFRDFVAKWLQGVRGIPSKNLLKRINIFIVPACNVLVEGLEDVYTVRNYGKATNCSLMTLFPAQINILSLSAGVSFPGDTFKLETGTMRKVRWFGVIWIVMQYYY